MKREREREVDAGAGWVSSRVRHSKKGVARSRRVCDSRRRGSAYNRWHVRTNVVHSREKETKLETRLWLWIIRSVNRRAGSLIYRTSIRKGGKEVCEMGVRKACRTPPTSWVSYRCNRGLRIRGEKRPLLESGKKLSIHAGQRGRIRRNDPTHQVAHAVT